MKLQLPITRTKIILPNRRPDLYSRGRLLELLGDILDYRLFIISAPAGYGKTSLLVDFAHQVNTPVCWFSIDAYDRDIQRFISHLIAAVNRRFPTFGAQTQDVLRNSRMTLLDIETLTSSLVNEAYEKINEHFILVLDDFHLVEGQSEVIEFINRFVQTMDENIHIVIASRSLLTLPDLPLLVARGMVGGLSFEELAFHPDEIQALILQNYRQSMSLEAAKELGVRTEGWVTGLLLSAPSFLNDSSDQKRVARASGVDLYEYLAQQVLDQQPPNMRDFLLRTSLLEEFDASLCEDVLVPICYTEPPNWNNLIGNVLRNNLFVIQVPEKETWLRYHHLFRDFLQARMTQEKPEEKKALLYRLAEVTRNKEEWDRAYAIYQDLHDASGIADLVEQAGSNMISMGRLNTLANWLDKLPEALVLSQPILLSHWGSVAVMKGDINRGLERLDQAENALRAQGDDKNLALTLERRAVAHSFLGVFEGALTDADAALSLMQAAEAPSIPQAEALRVKGSALYQMGRVNEATEFLREARQKYESLQNAYSVAVTDQDLGILYRSIGDYDAALDSYSNSLEFWRRSGNMQYQANLLNNLGVLYHELGNYEAAASVLDEALVCARRSNYARIEAYALASLGDVFSDLGSQESARGVYRQAGEIAERVQEHALRFYLDLALVNIDRLVGDLDQAQNRMGWVAAFLKGKESGPEWAQYQFQAGRLALDRQAYDQAEGAFRIAADTFTSSGKQMPSACALLYLAEVYHRKGDSPAARDVLRKALKIAERLGIKQPLVIVGLEVKSLLAASQSDPDIGRMVAQLLDRIQQYEGILPRVKRHLRRKVVAVSLDAPRLVIRAFGRCQVLRDGVLVSRSDWQTQVARSLFFFLLSQPDFAPRDKIVSTFWPELSIDQIRLLYKNTLYRIRQALGPDVVLSDTSTYWFNRSLDYDYDVENFHGSLEQAHTLADRDGKVAAYQKAIELYQGQYLSDVDDLWVPVEREKLHQEYLTANQALAEVYLGEGGYEKVLELANLVLAKDPIQEEFHRLVMRAHAARGNRAAVVRQYDFCRKVLGDELGVAPSVQTQKLYELLIR